MFDKKTTVCIIGLGYIGLPTAALLASNGSYHVNGVDINESVVNTINKGEIHIVEPNLDKFVKDSVHSGTLKASIQVTFADVFIIAVPTPFHEGYKPNIDYVIDATRSIAPFIKEGNIIILESTSPIGTTDKINYELKKLGVNTDDIYIAYCPERVLPGKIMFELIENDRIVGGINSKSTEKVAAFYKTFVKGAVLQTNAKTAEMCKLTENSYRDVSIAFANELSMICDKAGIDVWELIALANHHPRVNILQPGAGVGGHCIAVDPWFLVSDFPNESRIIKTGREVNNFKSEWVLQQIKTASTLFEQKNKRKPLIACMGLAFKPDIDDLRESPALSITKKLKDSFVDIISVEPNIVEYKEEINLRSLNDAIQEADIFCFLVKHSVFNSLEFREGAIILDFCGLNKTA